MIVGHELDWGKPVGHEIMPPYKEYPQGNHFVIYTKPNCIQCKMSIRLMDRLGTMYEHTYYGDATQTNDINISSTDKAKQQWSLDKIAKIKRDYHIQQLPLVKVVDQAGRTVDYWAGFRPDKIKEYANGR